MNRVSVAVAVDSAFVQHLGVMLSSLYANTSNADKIDLYVISANLESEPFERLRWQLSELGAKVKFIHFDESLVKGFPVDGHIKVSSYYRLFLHLLLPENCNRCIYLDADLLILGAIEELWAVETSNAVIAGVPDSQDELRDLSIIGIDDPQSYVNAGVLIIDLRHWRENKVHETFLNYILCHRSNLMRHDQDVLNACFEGDKWLLAQEWNLTRGPAFKRYLPLLFGLRSSMPKIVHYTSAFKPWNRDDPHPLRGLYWKYLKQTPWRDYRMPPITWRQHWKTFYLRCALIYFNLKRMVKGA